MFFETRLSLVIGGAGFIGTHIAKALLDRGGRVRLTGHRRAPILSDPRIEIVQADLTRQEDCLRAMKDVDLVFHAAGAVTGIGVTAHNAMAGITTNLNLTAQVMQAAWTIGVERILIFSSSTAYPASNHPIREDELWNGLPHPSYLGYGWMRRYFEPLSEFVPPTTSHVMPALVRKAVEKLDPFEVWGTGDEVRDFLHVTDFARGCLLMMEKYAVCDPVNIGYGAAMT